MRLTLLCSDENHPVNRHLIRWMQRAREVHDIALIRRKKDLPGGDILFLISCEEILNTEDRGAYRACLVLHASDLPLGRGWSPHIWQIIEGAQKVTVSLLEVEDKVDTGRIWTKKVLDMPKHALWDEINEQLFEAEIELINFAIDAIDEIVPQPQSSHITPTYYTRRMPADSRIDPTQSIQSQFNAIRVCDPERFPAFFELDGFHYKISLEKMIEPPNKD